MNKLLILLIVFSCPAFSQSHLTTPFESSNGTETGTYEEVIRFYRMLSVESDMVRIREMGLTDSGQPLHLILIDPDKSFDLAHARQMGKTIVLINNGIHPGEPDGIEASMMLARDLTRPENSSLMDNTLVAIIPIYNIGGALNRNSTSRVNQLGPKAYGFRGNARNYDLNRDFIKADTRNTRAFYEIYHLVDPDIFVDTHVSDGADYQYRITHLASQHNRIGGVLGEYMHTSFLPALEAKMIKRNNEMTPYVNVFNQSPDTKGFSQFMDSPRYSTGYTTLFGTLSFMIETHMLKPFDQRVEASYDFLFSILQLAVKEGPVIKKLRKEMETYVVPGEDFPVDWTLDTSRKSTFTFKGYEAEMIPSKITGLERLHYDRSKPYEKEIPYYNYFIPAKEVVVPEAYIIPQGWVDVIDLLKLNGAGFRRLQNDSSMTVGVYHISSFKTVENAYEGHYPHSSVEVEESRQKVEFSAGDYVFTTYQPAARYLVETLEPEATDSFFKWNFFDTILQQKEGFSPYVFEELATEIIKNDPELKEELETRKKSDTAFAENGYAQLKFIYQHSDYAEKAYMRYPVYRLLSDQ